MKASVCRRRRPQPAVFDVKHRPKGRQRPRRVVEPTGAEPTVEMLTHHDNLMRLLRVEGEGRLRIAGFLAKREPYGALTEEVRDAVGNRNRVAVVLSDMLTTLDVVRSWKPLRMSCPNDDTSRHPAFDAGAENGSRGGRRRPTSPGWGRRRPSFQYPLRDFGSRHVSSISVLGTISFKIIAWMPPAGLRRAPAPPPPAAAPPACRPTTYSPAAPPPVYPRPAGVLAGASATLVGV